MNTNNLNLFLKKILADKVKIVIMKSLFPFRNKFILFNATNFAKSKRVNLNYWSESANLGDTLSPLIVNYVLSLKNISPDIIVNNTKHLYAVGSVLTAGIQDCTVWGSGVLNAKLTYRLKNRKFDIRSVRGPITRAILIDYGFKVPEIYGDPAILLPDIYMPGNLVKKAKFGLILHKDYANMTLPSNCIDIDICTDDYKKFIDDLNSVDIIIASSLHGIILAESYGIPAILLKPHVDIVKYYDWYYSTGRVKFPIADTIEDAMKTDPVELPELKKLKVDLIKHFPYDIYI
jgi:pyruvyltransferase